MSEILKVGASSLCEPSKIEILRNFKVCHTFQTSLSRKRTIGWIFRKRGDLKQTRCNSGNYVPTFFSTPKKNTRTGPTGHSGRRSLNDLQYDRLGIPDSQQISSWRFNGIYPCSKIDDRVSPNRSLSGKEWAHNPTEHESETIGQSKRGINIREWWSEPWAEVDFCCSPTPLGYSLRGKYWRAAQNENFLKSFSPMSIWIYFQKYLLWGCTTAQIGSKGAW